MSMMFNPATQIAARSGTPWMGSGSGPVPLIESSRKSWGAVTAIVTEKRCEGPFDADFTAGRDQLVAILEEVGGRIEMRCRSQGAAPAAGAGSRPLSLIPAGVPVRGVAGNIRLVRYLVLELDLLALSRLHDRAAALAPALQPRLMFANPRLMQLCQLFADACADPVPASTLYGDSLSLALLACLQDLRDEAELAPKPAGLLPWQMNAAIRFMHENMASNFPLSAVAERVRLSRSYFGRGFRESTGSTPHQWLIKARVARAQEMMVGSDKPLADVALAVGFSDQAHFTRSFTKLVGRSPGAWRRAHG